MHSVETDRIPDLENAKIIKSNRKNYHIRISLEGWFCKMQNSAPNEVSKIFSEYAVLK